MWFNLDVHYSIDNEQVNYEAKIKIHYGTTIFFNITVTVGYGVIYVLQAFKAFTVAL